MATNLTTKEINTIKVLAEAGVSNSEICRITGRSAWTVSSIRCGKREERIAEKKDAYRKRVSQKEEPKQIVEPEQVEIVTPAEDITAICKDIRESLNAILALLK